jgi:hypothetical protein
MAGNTIVVNGKEYQASPIQVDNWLDNTSADYHFRNQTRRGPVTEVILHETVTRSHDATVKVLQPATAGNPGGRGLGVHFIVEADGMVYQHGDLATDLLWHAGQHNGPSVGIEVVNPYEPRFMPAKGPWTTVIVAPWAAGGKYVVPTKAQLEATACLVVFLTMKTDESPPELQIPARWIGLNGTKLIMGPVLGATKLVPGIYAHQYFHHADGSFLVLYSFLRIVCGLSVDDAYSESIRRATGARGVVDLTDLFDANPYIQMMLDASK